VEICKCKVNSKGAVRDNCGNKEDESARGECFYREFIIYNFIVGSQS